MSVDPEGILAITFIFGGGSAVLLAMSPIGKAIGDRIRHGKRPPGTDHDPAVFEELEQLRADVTDLQERLDFAERLLAEKRAAQLPPGGEGH